MSHSSRFGSFLDYFWSFLQVYSLNLKKEAAGSFKATVCPPDNKEDHILAIHITNERGMQDKNFLNNIFLIIQCLL
jgi:hypothetical protein